MTVIFADWPPSAPRSPRDTDWSSPSGRSIPRFYSPAHRPLEADQRRLSSPHHFIPITHFLFELVHLGSLLCSCIQQEHPPPLWICRSIVIRKDRQLLRDPQLFAYFLRYPAGRLEVPIRCLFWFRGLAVVRPPTSARHPTGPAARLSPFRVPFISSFHGFATIRPPTSTQRPTGSAAHLPSSRFGFGPLLLAGGIAPGHSCWGIHHTTPLRRHSLRLPWNGMSSSLTHPPFCFADWPPSAPRRPHDAPPVPRPPVVVSFRFRSLLLAGGIAPGHSCWGTYHTTPLRHHSTPPPEECFFLARILVSGICHHPPLTSTRRPTGSAAPLSSSRFGFSPLLLAGGIALGHHCWGSYHTTPPSPQHSFSRGMPFPQLRSCFADWSPSADFFYPIRRRKSIWLAPLLGNLPYNTPRLATENIPQSFGIQFESPIRCCIRNDGWTADMRPRLAFVIRSSGLLYARFHPAGFPSRRLYLDLTEWPPYTPGNHTSPELRFV
ncbi:hypothetical protein Hypma_010617 [Hypsizygus marmoreus]|uniref:Uncharacterized protein n=1 Tax=Hypsizygus marmoreus TaxID=39966 RepID=A0A369JJS7_HYPMA|nr:hypothetical protein Hypma_010617 [Hypsizygus marmoreus]